MGFGSLFGHVLGFECSTELLAKGNGRLVTVAYSGFTISQVNTYG